MKIFELDGYAIVKDYTKHKFSWAFVSTIVLFIAVAIFLYAGWCAGCVISYMPHTVLNII